ncbi:MAG: hypothetical protein J6Q22_00335 [Prevotella sp.]|nr:hypothetical protein [Prevotella sp.]
MFGITIRHNLLKSGILQGKTDIHCHVLPGVDDGSPDLSHSLEILSFMEMEMGFRSVCLTPHVMQDYPNNAAMLRKHFEAFLPHYKGSLQLHLAAEYMLDASFAGHLHDGVLPLAQQHLLVETSYMSAPVGLQDILLDIWHQGYRPVLAHPERYMYMEESDYAALKAKGYAFQLNLLSLSGYYGRRPKQISEHLLKQGYYDFVGTDLHHLERYEDYLYDMKLTRKQLDTLEQLFENNTMFNVQ